MKKMLLLATGLAALVTLQGCIPVAVVGGASTAMTSAAEERGISGVISDADIKTRIALKFSEHDSELFANITIVVRQGRVLLTGTLSKPQKHIAAVRYAWEVRGVNEVMDEIKTGTSESAGVVAKDAWISTQLKSKMLFGNDISSINYNIQTEQGVVYVMGIAQDKTELSRVLNLIRNTSGVKKVVNYVTIRTQIPGASKTQNIPDATSMEPVDGGDSAPSSASFEPVDSIDSTEPVDIDTPSAFD
jgi:osmotically-inducible protein OsmY